MLNSCSDDTDTHPSLQNEIVSMKINGVERQFEVIGRGIDFGSDGSGHPSDPSVFLLRAFKYLIANQELLTIRRRAKESARHAQESGRFLCRAPYGYLNGNEPRDKRTIEIDESTAYIVKKIFRDFLSGVPHFLIHQEAKKLGFPLRGNSAIFRILNNPLYARLVRACASGKYPEKLAQGIHKPIITESQYFRIDMLENGF